MADSAVSVNDASTGSKIPIDGVSVTAGSNPTTGNALRQGMAIGDGAGAAQFAGVAAAQSGDVVSYRLAVAGAPRGIGPTTQVPTVAASTYSLVGTPPTGAIGVRFFLLSGGAAAVNFVVAASAGAAASGFVVPLSNPAASGAPLTHDVDLAGGMGVYIVGPYTTSSLVGFRYI